MSEKKFSGSAASVVDLKAELYRKQREYERGKPDSGGPKWQPKKVPQIWGKPNAIVKPKATGDKAAKGAAQPEPVEESELLQKSRSALEAKAKLYAKLSKDASVLIDDDEKRESILVDFVQKARDSPESVVEVPEEDVEEEEPDIPIPAPSGPDEEWVEYTDSLGRTRKCLRKDLASFQAQDAEYSGASRTSLLDSNKWKPEDLDQEEKRQELHKKWDKEEEEANEKGTVHYQDVLFDEARSHGVGYFAFSRDEEIRKEQMVTLQEQREKTAEQRERNERLKSKRKEQLDARLKKVRERKRLKMGLPLEDSHDSDPEEPADDMDVADIALPSVAPLTTTLAPSVPAPAVSTAVAPETNEKEQTLDANGDPVRSWDFGKPGVFAPRKILDQSEWVARKRAERNTDFAPPSAYSSTSSWSRQKGQKSSRQWNRDSTGGSSSRYKEDDGQPSQARRGTQVPPPATYDYYGPTRGKAPRGRGNFRHKQEMEDAISSGLAYLRQQQEKESAGSK